MLVQLIFLSLVGAIIGWVTNWLAVKMLFRPYQPINIPVLGYTLQGLVPKRQKEIALLVGQVVQQELLNIEDLLALLKEEELNRNITEHAVEAIRFRVMAKLPKFLPMSLRAVASDVVQEVLEKEVPDFLEEITDNFTYKFKDQINISAVVEKKINQLNLQELEKLVLSIASKELKHIEYLGAVLGLLIGLLQALLLTLF